MPLPAPIYPRHSTRTYRACGSRRRKHVAAPHEARIALDSFPNGVRVLISGMHGYQCEVSPGLDEVLAAIAQRVRVTLYE